MLLTCFGYRPTDRACQVKLICVVKNDLDRVKCLIDYYRRLGVGHFIFLDDGSSDGTREYLLDQQDADVWCSDRSYSTDIRQAWINRLIDIYGFNQWYIVVDSDELITYPYCESVSLIDITRNMAKQGYLQAHCFMLDMYTCSGLFTASEKSDFTYECRYFDCDGYELRIELS